MKKSFSHLGQRDIAGGAMKQPHPDIRLEISDHLAERRRRYAQLLGCPTETQALCNRDEGTQLIVFLSGQQVHHQSVHD